MSEDDLSSPLQGFGGHHLSFAFDGKTLLDHAREINASLVRIADVLENVARANESNNKTPIMEDDSIGTCPNCESTDIDQAGNIPNALFKCKTCNAIWMNKDAQFFSR